MNKLSQLIQELCPEGVESYPLKKVAKIKRGVRVTKSQLLDNGYPVYQNALAPMGYYSEFNTEENTTYIISAGAAGEIGFSKEKFWAADDCLVFTELNGAINRYIYHFLMTKKVLISSRVRKASVPRLSREVIENLLIPLPPLPVQQEIVRILDSFTDLSAELKAELKARKKQYEYYRDKLLKFEVDAANEVVWKTLGEIAEIKTGKKPNAIFKKGLFEYINAGTSHSGYTNTFNFPADTITTPSRGQGGIGYVGYQKVKFWLGPLCYGIRSKDTTLVNNKFLYYFLSQNSGDILQRKNEGGTPSLNLVDLRSIRICLPSTVVQKRIVSLLDNFDSLCNDLTAGLPAEIEAREKQYEYYRDKLLTFKELPSKPKEPAEPQSRELKPEEFQQSELKL